MSGDAKTFKVGVFEHPRKRSTLLMAYTTWYNPQWQGCCEHTVTAMNGTAAKRYAIEQHKVHCLKQVTKP